MKQKYISYREVLCEQLKRPLAAYIRKREQDTNRHRFAWIPLCLVTDAEQFDWGVQVIMRKEMPG